MPLVANYASWLMGVTFSLAFRVVEFNPRMFEIVKRLFLIPSGIRWVKALELAAKAEYEGALAYLAKIERYMHKNPEYHMLKGSVEVGAGNFDKSLVEMGIAKSQIETSDKYSEADKTYMLAYVQCWEGKAYEHTGREELAKHSFGKISYTSIDLDKVKNALKLNFPLRSHPRWIE